MCYPRHVVIVREGQWGFMDRTILRDNETYEQWVQSITRNLRDARRQHPVTGAFDIVATVEVVDTLAEARGRVDLGGVDVLVFISFGMRDGAIAIARAHPSLRIIVLTGLPENGERDGVHVVSKTRDAPEIIAAILGW